jgi:hypothetical protein
MTWTRWLLLSLLVVLSSASAVSAQSVKDYDPLPYNNSLDAILKEQMLQSKGLDGLQALLNEIRNHPEKYQPLFNQKLFKNGDVKDLDPTTRKQFEKLMKDNSDLKIDAEKLRAMEHVLKKQEEDAASVDNKGAKVHSPQRPEVSAPPPPPNPRDARPNLWDGFFKKALTRMLERAEHMPSTQDSPAFAKLKAAVEGHLFNNEGQPNALTKSGLDALSKAGGLPDIGSVDPPRINSGLPTAFLPHLGGLGGVGGGLRGDGGAGGVAFIQILLVVTVFVVVAVVAWRLMGRVTKGTPQVAAASLGPWPVDPSRIATREQLVQAFEYLALLVLGNPARTANHRDIAESLGTTPEQGQAAEQLASLYEKSRYDPAPGALPAAELDAARRDLCLLAGRHSPASGEG